MSFAVTRPINPAGVLPILSAEQVWKGLELKESQPSLFIPAIETCKVVKQDKAAGTLVREVEFKHAPGKIVTETIESHKPAVVYFEAAETGQRVTNVLSYGPNDELFLTFSFAVVVPGVPNPSEVSSTELNKKVGISVQSTIDAIRGMVKEGKL